MTVCSQTSARPLNSGWCRPRDRNDARRRLLARLIGDGQGRHVESIDARGSRETPAAGYDAGIAVIQTRARSPQQAPLTTAFPAIVRPVGAPRATTPAPVAEPSHHHLPAWVKRAYAQARPILADLLGSLEGTPRDDFQRAIDDITERINAGKFSQAFQYPQLIATGMELYTQQRSSNAERARAAHALDLLRRKGSDMLRDAGPQLAPDATSRLSRALRGATTAEEIAEVETEVRQAVEREITKTRTKIQRAAPRAQARPVETTETWQDVLRRLQEQMAQEAGA
jgi:hypothetical protein